jgi:hypothetical protein
LAAATVCWPWIATATVVINDGGELFGYGTTLANGSKAGTGYAALTELDTNGDGVVDAKDSAYADLRVWVDGNADGVSQSDELKSLDSLGITKLNLDVTKDVSLNNGNFVGLTSTYETADGASHTAADVWFQSSADKQQPERFGQQPVGSDVELRSLGCGGDLQREQAGSAWRHAHLGGGPGRCDRSVRQQADRRAELGGQRGDVASESAARQPQPRLPGCQVSLGKH